MEGTETIDIGRIGFPIPNEWQVQQVQMPDGRMYVKLVVLSPAGIVVSFWDGNQAQGLAAALRNAGRAVAAGIWTPGGPQPTQRAEGTSGANGPSAPSTADSGRL